MLKYTETLCEKKKNAQKTTYRDIIQKNDPKKQDEKRSKNRMQKNDAKNNPKKT